MIPASLGELIARLKQGNIVPRPDGEDWSGMIERTGTAGRVALIDGEIYDYFLEVLPPRWMGMGCGFAFAEGDMQIANRHWLHSRSMSIPLPSCGNSWPLSTGTAKTDSLRTPM